jgi:hypothetical protein
MRRALKEGRPVRIDPASTIADGIAVREVRERTLALAKTYVDDVVTVSEEELARAVLLLVEIEKTVVEGAGAAPLAALLNRELGLEGRSVVLVLSGGNIDVTMLARIIERGLAKDGRLVRLVVLLRDRPGALARLTAVVAEERANVVHIEHDRRLRALERHRRDRGGRDAGDLRPRPRRAAPQHGSGPPATGWTKRARSPYSAGSDRATVRAHRSRAASRGSPPRTARSSG